MATAKEGLPITPAIVRWARERSGYSIEDAKRHFKKIAAWEAGEALPTYAQVEDMADRFKVPVAVFFFPKPPEVPPLEKSFRTLTAEDFAAIPRRVRFFLRQGQAMQLNLAELNDGKNPAPHLITRDLKVTPNTSLGKIAADVRKFLGVSVDQQAAWKNVDEALEKWREVFAAKAGIYAFKDAFRAPNYFGFCLYDDEFPVIYINNSSAKSRQIFTLFHELGHLLFHTSGVDLLDDPFIKHLGDAEQKIEIICNGLAARVLVPDDLLDQMLKGMKIGRLAASQLGDHFNVSREVIYRKFLDRGLIAADEYVAAAKEWAAQMKKPEGAEPSGNYYNSQHAYLGQRYIDLAFTRYHQQRFDQRQLAEYLNMKPKSLPTFAEKFAGGGL
ncbi:ImmA/IrrE family metallo-endopeptidase [Paraburkholderia sprentiae WSM5005]|uniref:ImmA/IrrE family metallo-endopeptidase n=1 Tax=Paraburkholderia sprentiae WSM5005 TaxID=754502 RepID=A0A1I9YIJ7_9BURK|nr:ImmA/IrrE family metallo-endopeptidase [Paraburkholderia sprentiae]APA86130.1 ImmA/IrrE family metallo-endopeptidase [Paraburkholderia sprentiae WSM5005]